MTGLVVKCVCQHCERITVVPQATVKAILSSVADDEFVEEAQRRVNQGQWSPDRFMSQSQCDDRAKLRVLIGAVIKANVDSIHSGEKHPVLQALASKCDELGGIYGNPLPERAYAINTTLPGREDRFQTHQMELAS